MIHNLFHRAALAAAICACVAGAGIAGEANERLSVQIDQDGRSETVVIDAMQPGETRQLAAESGKPVIVTRTDAGLEIDIDGDLTRVPLREHAIVMRLDGAQSLQIEQLREIALHAADAEAGGEHRRMVRVLQAGHDGDAQGEHAGHEVHVRHFDADAAHDAAGVDGKRRVVLVRHGEAGAVDLDALLEERGMDAMPGEGKRVIVKRELVE